MYEFYLRVARCGRTRVVVCSEHPPLFVAAFASVVFHLSMHGLDVASIMLVTCSKHDTMGDTLEGGIADSLFTIGSLEMTVLSS